MSLLKEKDQALTVGATLSKMREFLCLHMFKEALANASKQNGLLNLFLAVVIISGRSRLSSSGMPMYCQHCLLKLHFQKRWSLVSNKPSSQRRQVPLSLKLKLLLMSISFVFRRSLASSQKKDLILGVHFDFQIQGEKAGV